MVTTGPVFLLPHFYKIMQDILEDKMLVEQLSFNKFVYFKEEEECFLVIMKIQQNSSVLQAAKASQKNTFDVSGDVP